MFNFEKIPPNQFTLLASLLGILLNIRMDANQQNSFGNFLVSVGQTMLTSAAQSEDQKAHPTKNSMLEQIDDMSTQLEKLKKQLKNL